MSSCMLNPARQSVCASGTQCALVSSDVVCLYCRLHVEQIKRRHVLAGPDRIKHQWEICEGSEPCWLSRLSPLIKRKLPAASAPSKIIVDEYPIRETWCVINPMWSFKKGGVGGLRGDAATFMTCVEDVSLFVLCYCLWPECENVYV